MKRSFAFITTVILSAFCGFSFAQTITTIAGNGSSSAEGIPATAAALSYAVGFAFDNAGNMYLAEGVGCKVRKIDAVTGLITTVAGTGTRGHTGDGGPATAAMLEVPYLLSFDDTGNLYVSEENGSFVRKVHTGSGIISTVAGNGVCRGGVGALGDGGLATSAEICVGQTRFDSKGDMYVTDRLAIRKINTSNIISTYAGTRSLGVTANNVPATSTPIGTTSIGLAFDSKENLYFDDATYSIRKISSQTGIMSIVAGMGDTTCSPNADGVAATATHIFSYGLWVDFFDNIYVSDPCNVKIFKIDTLGIIRTIAGTGTAGYSGDGGPATAAQISYPENVILDLCGNIIISDFGNNKIRKITMPSNPGIALSGTTASPVGSTVTIKARVGNAGPGYTIKWKKNGVVFATTSTPSVTFTKSSGIDSITAMVYGCSDSASSGLHRVVVGTSYTPIANVAVNEVFVFPNPAKEQIEIKGEDIVSAKLLDIMGRVVLAAPMHDGSNIVSISSLPQGNYILEVINTVGLRSMHRLVKE